MRIVAILSVLIGSILIGVGVTWAQPPPPPPNHDHPPCQNPPCRDRNGRGERDGNRNGGDGDNDGEDEAADQAAGESAAVAESEQTANLITAANTVSTTNPLLGGTLTVFDASDEAFTNHLPNFSEAEIARFEEADELFEQIYLLTSDPNSGAIDDGLGPFYNATSCEGCHVEDGRGRPPEFPGETATGFLIRLAREERTLNGGTMPDPIYGGQLQDLSVEGIAPEGTVSITYTEVPGTFADGTPYSLRVPSYTINGLPYGALAADVSFSPRVANQMIGLGLLEAISEDTLLGFADPADTNGDGISGRPNLVWDAYNNRTALGRFGWKANQPHLIQQTAGAFNGDMGISTSLFSSQPCTEAQIDCAAMLHGGETEISDDDFLAVVFYSSTLAVPAQRNTDDPLVQQGEQLFNAAQCSSCHIPQTTTGIHPTIPQLSNQTIRPFTDLLLHDMGAGLADGQSDFQATGSEWRTPPLWGIGLFETVNGHTYYLHDGRARDLTEAILWHGGEAQTSRDYFANLSAPEREALLAFLRSL